MPLLPAVLERSGHTFTLAMDPDLTAFQGHFPGHPVLPGVVQVDWAVRFGSEAFGPLGRFRAIEHLKFQDPIRPGGTGAAAPRLPSRPGAAALPRRGRAGSGNHRA